MITDRTIGTALARIRAHLRDDPPPVVTLIAQHGHDSFKVLVSTLLSLRTKDAVTTAACQRVFARASTPRELLRIPARELARIIYPVGFSNTKARTLRTIAQLLLDRHAGAVPQTMDDLLALPGVGRKTANLVRIEGFGLPGICVDTHVHRISNRWGYVRTRTPEQTEIALRARLPARHWHTYNMLLVGFGQTTCVPISPRCSTCPLRQMCPRVGVARHR